MQILMQSCRRALFPTEAAACTGYGAGPRLTWNFKPKGTLKRQKQPVFAPANGSSEN